MGLHFLTPLAAAVALAVALPLLGVAVRERKEGRVRSALGLLGPPPVLRAETALYSVAAIAALGLAAAQPTLHRSRPLLVRADSEAYFVFDTSRSMLARRTKTSPTRFERAIRLGIRMRRALGGVSVGVGSLTDRALPHLLPTPDEQAFADVAHKALGIDRPPPEQRSHLATDFDALADITSSGWFAQGSGRRLVVLFTDGETRGYSASTLESTFASAHAHLIAVRVSTPGEAIYLPNGSRDPHYRPSPSVGLAGLDAFDESHVGAATKAARAVVEHGPRIQAGRTESTVPLSRYAVLAAALPIALLLFRRR